MDLVIPAVSAHPLIRVYKLRQPLPGWLVYVQPPWYHPCIRICDTTSQRASPQWSPAPQPDELRAV
jgi:hypothetical protein